MKKLKRVKLLEGSNVLNNDAMKNIKGGSNNNGCNTTCSGPCACGGTGINWGLCKTILLVEGPRCICDCN